MILGPAGSSAGIAPEELMAASAAAGEDEHDAASQWAQMMAFHQWNQQQVFPGISESAHEGFFPMQMEAAVYQDAGNGSTAANGGSGDQPSADVQLDDLFSELQADLQAQGGYPRGGHVVGNIQVLQNGHHQPANCTGEALFARTPDKGEAFAVGGHPSGAVTSGAMNCGENSCNDATRAPPSGWMLSHSAGAPEAQPRNDAEAEQNETEGPSHAGSLGGSWHGRHPSGERAAGAVPEEQGQEQRSQQPNGQDDAAHRPAQLDRTGVVQPSISIAPLPAWPGERQADGKAASSQGNGKESAGTKKGTLCPGAVVVELSSSSSAGGTLGEENDLLGVDSQPSSWTGEERNAKRRKKSVLHPGAAPATPSDGPMPSSSQGGPRTGCVASDTDEEVVLVATRLGARTQQGAPGGLPTQQQQLHEQHVLNSLMQQRWQMHLQQDPRQAIPGYSGHNGAGGPSLPRPHSGSSLNRSAFRSPFIPGPSSQPGGSASSLDRAIVPVQRSVQPEPQEFHSILEGLTFSGTSHEVEVEEGLLSVPLLKHQRLALGWMEQREKSCPAGGILADDQGLGKTVSTIALIVRCHHRRKQQALGMVASSNDNQGPDTLRTPGMHGSQGTEGPHPGSQASIDTVALPEPQARPKAEVVNLDDDDVVSPRSGKGTCPGGGPKQTPGVPQMKPEPGTAWGAVQPLSRPNAQAKRLPGGTLVVCPTSVLWQWEKELRAKLGPLANDLSVLVYHGVNRSKKSAAELASFGVVLTTYAIVGLDVPRAEGGKGAEERERKEALGIPTGKAKGIKAPWAAFLPEAQQQQQQKPKRGAASDGVRGPLACISWHRVVLDEAQCIKNRTTQMAFACWGLRAKRRWCLSGTPIQNTVDDIYSYFRFLRYSPYDDYAAFRSQLKDPTTGMQRLQAVLKAVMLRRTKRLATIQLDGPPVPLWLPSLVVLFLGPATKLEGKPIIQLPQRVVRLCEIEFSAEERKMYTNLEITSKTQFQNFAKSGSLKKNYMSILVMLLRLRQFCNHPHLLDTTSRSKLASSDAGSTEGRSAQQSAGRALSLPLQKRVQLLSCYQEGGDLCGACGDLAAEAPAVTKCGHSFCLQCILQHLEQSDAATCPTCQQPLTPASVFAVSDLEVAAGGATGGHNQPLGAMTGGSTSDQHSASGAVLSAKTRELLKLLLALPYVHYKAPGTTPLLLPASGAVGAVKEEGVEQGLANAGAVVPAEGGKRMFREKAIVFSQWSSMLDLVERPLRDAGVKYVRLDGSMSCAERDQAVTKFVTTPEITVILMSLKAASLGLNLVVARHVVLLDLWWNPATEEQAIDRAHRIGQTRPVHVSRFAVKDTIEDRILELQARKRTMVASAFGESQDGQNATRLTMDDLAFLFSSGLNS